jgi:hypothetical protein
MAKLETLRVKILDEREGGRKWPAGVYALVPKRLAYESAAFISTSSLSSFSPDIHSFDLYPQTMSTW